MEFEIRFIENVKMESIVPLLLQLNPNIPTDVLKNRFKGYDFARLSMCWRF